MNNSLNFIKEVITFPAIYRADVSHGYHYYKKYYLDFDSSGNEVEIVLDAGSICRDFFLPSNDKQLVDRRDNFHPAKGKPGSIMYYDAFDFTDNILESHRVGNSLSAYFNLVESDCFSRGYIKTNPFHSLLISDFHADLMKKLILSGISVNDLLIFYLSLNPKYNNANYDILIQNLNIYMKSNNLGFEILFIDNEYVIREINTDVDNTSNVFLKLKDATKEPMIRRFTFEHEYYVYRHYYIDKKTGNDITFYVGKGRGSRALSKSRSVMWDAYVKKAEKFGNGLQIDILKYFKEESSALLFEKAVISYYSLQGQPLVNVVGRSLDEDEISNIVNQII